MIIQQKGVNLCYKIEGGKRPKIYHIKVDWETLQILPKCRDKLSRLMAGPTSQDEALTRGITASGKHSNPVYSEFQRILWCGTFTKGTAYVVVPFCLVFNVSKFFLISDYMSRDKEQLSGVTLLGNTGVKYPTEYAPEILETFVNKHPDNEYLVTFTCPEFTSLCPKTGQPDFAKIIISYIPRQRMVESKSLKLYLFSFRNHGDFHEDCINIIMKDLVKLMDPKYLEVVGLFTPRGGISIFPFANYGDAEHQELVKTRRIAAFEYGVKDMMKKIR